MSKLTKNMEDGLAVLGSCRLVAGGVEVTDITDQGDVVRVLGADDLRALSFACREVAELLEKKGEVDQEIPLTDHHKAFLISVALSNVFDVKAQEKGDTKASLRRRKQLRAIEALLVKATDLYLPPAGFDAADMGKAVQIHDLVNKKIRELYPAEVGNGQES